MACGGVEPRPRRRGRLLRAAPASGTARRARRERAAEMPRADPRAPGRRRRPHHGRGQRRLRPGADGGRRRARARDLRGRAPQLLRPQVRGVRRRPRPMPGSEHSTSSTGIRCRPAPESGRGVEDQRRAACLQRLQLVAVEVRQRQPVDRRRLGGVRVGRKRRRHRQRRSRAARRARFGVCSSGNRASRSPSCPGGGGMKATIDLMLGTNLNVYSAISSASRRTSRPRSSWPCRSTIEQSWPETAQGVHLGPG